MKVTEIRELVYKYEFYSFRARAIEQEMLDIERELAFLVGKK